MRVITYSLWGSNPKYLFGAIKNATDAKRFYPDWTCIFYCNESVPKEVIKNLSDRDNTIVRMLPGEGNRYSAIYRFFPSDENGIEYLISRDCDSRLSQREVVAVKEWIKKETDVHIIRDHYHHNMYEILGGLWGVRGGRLKGIAESAKNYLSNFSENYTACDQEFLRYFVWQKIVRRELSVTVHDDYFNQRPLWNTAWENRPDLFGTPFPKESQIGGKENNGVLYIGEIFDENDVRLFFEIPKGVKPNYDIESFYR